MKKFTQADFENFDRDEYGHKICPPGDYTAIRDFGNDCRFGEWCRFGNGCSFGKRCSFGECCSFGGWCSFGECCRFSNDCSFGKSCSFGEHCWFSERCSFGDYCSFGEWCIFGRWCSFGECCIFGEHCDFGERCDFGEWCSFESGAVKNGKYVAIDRIGSEDRKTYFFIDENGKVYVRAGCWFSDLDSFKKRVKEVHAGTVHEKTYLMACDLAEMMLKEV